jgi:hypothetical protein
MLKKHVFIALFVSAFMFPFFGNVSNADALGMYGCSTVSGFDGSPAHIDCLRGKLDSTPFGKTVPPGARGHGYYSCDRLPNGNLDSNTPRHVNCLRRLLDQHGAHMQVGNPGGGAPGIHPPMGDPGAHPPETFDEHLMGGTHDTGHCAQFTGAAQTACYSAANSGPPAGGTVHCDSFSGPARRACMDAAIRGRP